MTPAQRLIACLLLVLSATALPVSPAVAAGPSLAELLEQASEAADRMGREAAERSAEIERLRAEVARLQSAAGGLLKGHGYGPPAADWAVVPGQPAAHGGLAEIVAFHPAGIRSIAVGGLAAELVRGTPEGGLYRLPADPAVAGLPVSVTSNDGVSTTLPPLEDPGPPDQVIELPAGVHRAADVFARVERGVRHLLIAAAPGAAREEVVLRWDTRERPKLGRLVTRGLTWDLGHPDGLYHAEAGATLWLDGCLVTKLDGNRFGGGGWHFARTTRAYATETEFRLLHTLSRFELLRDVSMINFASDAAQNCRVIIDAEVAGIDRRGWQQHQAAAPHPDVLQWFGNRPQAIVFGLQARSNRAQAMHIKPGGGTAAGVPVVGRLALVGVDFGMSPGGDRLRAELAGTTGSVLVADARGLVLDHRELTQSDPTVWVGPVIVRRSTIPRQRIDNLADTPVILEGVRPLEQEEGSL